MELTVRIPDDLRQAVESAAQADGKTVDALAVEALKKHLGRRGLERLKREAESRRKNLTDEQVREIVEQAIAETRAERGR
jgi:predicted transcriptional regulator